MVTTLRGMLPAMCDGQYYKGGFWRPFGSTATPSHRFICPSHSFFGIGKKSHVLELMEKKIANQDINGFYIIIITWQEMSQVNNVREVLQRSGQVATNVGSILDSFEHRLARLETTILPVYQQTGNLQRRQLSKF